MAIQINTTLQAGVVAAKCYAKIIRAEYLTATGVPDPTPGIRLFVAFYFNKASRTVDENIFVEQREYLLEDMTKETRDEQYKYLKILDEFKGAIDI